jgi:hypothetical protein
MGVGLSVSTDQHWARALVARLRGRRDEIEQLILTRISAVESPAASSDAEYELGLRAAVRAALSYWLDAIDPPADSTEPVPSELLAQARRAARAGVGLDTILRRYLAGYSLLDDLILQESVALGGGRPDSQETLRREASLLDGVIDAVARAYNEETETGSRQHDRRRPELVRKLLTGELSHSEELNYEFRGWHIGLIVDCLGLEQRIREVAANLDLRPLLVPGPERRLWAWFGAGDRSTLLGLQRAIAAAVPAEVRIGLGEPGEGLLGWRLSHRQARAAMSADVGEPGGLVHYRDIALVTCAQRDELLADFLRQAYLVPLQSEPDGGRALRQALRAYLAAGRSVSSAAAALGVSRQTVKKRIGVAEDRIGQPLAAKAAEIETALRLAALEADSATILQPS